MPLFEYRCEACGKRFEKLVLGGREAEIVCPDCGSAEAERQLSTFATVGGGCGPSGRFT